MKLIAGFGEVDKDDVGSATNGSSRPGAVAANG